jgi:uncharacterized membrane protein
MKIKLNLFLLIITSVICLLPIILSVVIYNDLPEKLVMQWNFEGKPNWYAPKVVAAFVMPLFFMVVNIITIFYIYNDPKRDNISKVMRIISVWLFPIISLIFVPILLLMGLAENMPFQIPVKMIALMVVGFVLIFCGNYMPKNKINYSIGIKLSWTYNDSENWNKTHRIAGLIWIIAGMLFIILAFLPLSNIIGVIIISIILLIMVFVPSLYSFFLYKKKEGLNAENINC